MSYTQPLLLSIIPLNKPIYYVPYNPHPQTFFPISKFFFQNIGHPEPFFYLLKLGDSHEKFNFSPKPS
jgi:hypothetical protein